MKAVRVYGKQDVRLEDVTIPEPNDDQVQIKVKFCGICGSDLHEYSEGLTLPTSRHPLSGKKLPITMGHEFAGEVVKVGQAVTQLKVGDPVAVEPLIACGHCDNCRAGKYNLCENAIGDDGSSNFIGFSDDGGYAEYANIREFFAHKMPAGMSYELGAVTEPTTVAYEAIKKSGLREGQTVAVMGAGPIGLLTAALAKIAGATRVFISDVSKERLQKAKELGLTDLLNPEKDDVATTIKQAVPGGVDIVYDAAGIQATFDTAIRSVKKAGKVMLIALFAKSITVDVTNRLIMQGLDILTTLGYNNDYPAVMQIINQHQDLFNQIITKKIPLDRAIEDGVKTLAVDKSQVKILISPEL
ncbi:MULTISPECIES: 2,3-butanediol dehydrogenase [Levilactobacillus]|uniref:2,3-butanediol dehydrogenase n=1 Tax=Levilactobacillus TaxID=2767886 RepID=UPI00195165D5|nr:2,3-butanediol dehydrogenase [Levilactobacillus sp. 244-2]